MKDSAAYNRLSIEYAKDMVALQTLAFDRAMERFDIEAANQAVAKREYWEREIERRKARKP